MTESVRIPSVNCFGTDERSHGGVRSCGAKARVVWMGNHPFPARSRLPVPLWFPMMAFRMVFSLVAFVLPVLAQESFEMMPAGALTGINSAYGKWTSAEGHAVIIAGKGRSGNQALHLTGGASRSAVLELATPAAAPMELDCWTERWTRRGTCEFRIEARAGGKWLEIKRDDEVKVGGFHTRVQASAPAGTDAIRFTCTSEAGLMIDDLSLSRRGPMVLLEKLELVNPVVPVLRRKPVNPAVGFTLTTEGTDSPVRLDAVELSLAGSTRPQDIARIDLLPGSADPGGKFGPVIATAAPAETVVLTTRHPLAAGANPLWVSVTLKDDARIDGRIAVTLRRVKAGGKVLTAPAAAAAKPQRIGVALRMQGDDGSHSYRIPGLVRTKAGSLVAVYDIRYGHCGDLPAQIDVGVSRSTDGGQTWEPMRIAMDCGTMGDAFEADGLGDPAVLADTKTGRLWLAALWSHGNRAWNGSGPGLTPGETGQLLLCHSDDDGRTWSALRNITPLVKDPSWRLVFNGPGAGICMRDGTLVFPAQFRSADGGETRGKPFSTILSSKDGGETWAIGTGAKIDTTEAQVAELGDGSLLLNCRDNRGGSRTVMTTRDLGRTWSAHSTDRKALPEPVCMASLLRWDHPQLGRIFAFSNPASPKGRNSMTLKFSRDDCATWPERWHLLYDVRTCAGYSCLAPASADHLGVLYEGPCELYFLRVPLAECLP